ncbi:MAG: ATP-binding protein [Halothiobacillaceae bacterium]|nr:ATP-binding protein [Halothiobacillaceae bacterium]
MGVLNTPSPEAHTSARYLRSIYRRNIRPLVPWVSGLVVVVLMGSLYLLTDALQNSARYESMYVWLLGVNVGGVLFLMIVVLANVWRLWQSVRAHVPGSRLTMRLLRAYVLLGLAPAAIVFFFSMNFIQRGIDSWFDVRIEQALNDALELSRASLEVRMRESLRLTRRAAAQLTESESKGALDTRSLTTMPSLQQGLSQLSSPGGTLSGLPTQAEFGSGDEQPLAERARDELAVVELDSLRRETDALEMSLFGTGGRIIASAADGSRGLVPERPGESVLAHVRQGNHYLALEPLSTPRSRGITPNEVDDGALDSAVNPPHESLAVRVVIPLDRYAAASDHRLLQAIFLVDARLATLADSVQTAFHQYRELIYLRHGLKQNFVMALGLALLLSVLTAVWLAFVAATRLTEPIRDLVLGTRAVADGDYTRRLPVQRMDDLGLLMRSFNTMTARIAESAEETRRLKDEAAAQRDYLETVLQHLSSGVLTLSDDGQVRHANAAAASLLGVPLGELEHVHLPALCETFAHLTPLCDALEGWLRQDGVGELLREVRLVNDGERSILMVRGAPLAHDWAQGSEKNDEEGGLVLVMDDITAIIQGQRDAAWSEVARRLAHEIKNPLTPIQLSAERLRRKLGPVLDSADGLVLERATHTIVQQVEAMKHMVNDFAEYARMPQSRMAAVNLTALVREVLDLYRDGVVRMRLLSDERPIWIEGDALRLRQLLHNLLKNAAEALQEATPPVLSPEVSVSLTLRNEAHLVELLVRDNGHGFPPDLLGQIFEPYVTTRPKGTGLGLAIVKKVVEEHAGKVRVFNAPEGGARALLSFPARTGNLEHDDGVDKLTGA